MRPHPEGTGNQTLFEPAFVKNLIEENALLTSPRGRVYVLPEVYEDFADAAVRTLVHQKEISGQSPLWEPLDPSSKRLQIEINHLPMASSMSSDTQIYEVTRQQDLRGVAQRSRSGARADRQEPGRAPLRRGRPGPGSASTPPHRQGSNGNR